MTRQSMRRPIAAGMGLLAVLALSTGGHRVEAAAPGAVPGSAKALVDRSGVRGGLVVVIGCGDPVLLAELRGAGPYLVHGLDADPAAVAAARKHLLQKDLHGFVTVSRLRGERLPFVDGLVNLIVIAGPPPISADEMKRALSPGGVIADVRGPEVGITRKAWPAALDTWTHYLYDASNNAVSKDTRIGLPQGLRWTCGPRYARSHEHFASVSAMVTDRGRIFYIIDEGPISSVYLPPRWMLVARDAFSGVLLWKKPLKDWEAHLRGFRSGPPEIGRRLVAAGDRLYVTLGYGEPVTVLDGATGKTIATLEGTTGARELLLADGVLYVLADDMTAEQHNERREQLNRKILDSPPEQIFWRRLPRGAFPIYGIQRIVALKVDEAKVLWERPFRDPGQIAPATMAVSQGKVCVQTLSHVVCLDASDGKERWRTERAIATSRYSWSTPTLVIQGGVVLTVDRRAADNVGASPPERGSEWLLSSGNSEKKQAGELVALSLDDGMELWRAPSEENYNVPLDIFVIDGVVWVGDLRHGDDTGFTEGRDLKSGRVVVTLPPQKAGGHHRCYRNKATPRWIFVGRGSLQFIDLKEKIVRQFGGARGACQYGVMPANGLIYVPQHSCACSPKNILTGLNVLAPLSSAGGMGRAPREKGPAYDDIQSLKAGLSGTGWPTYRRDVRRSGRQDLPAPVKPAVAWTRKLAPPVTAPVAEGDLVLVAERDRHALHALSVAEGKPAWRFVADGRIDSPPTLSGGLCLFGTRNGFVYCLRASDGALAWRFRAAPRESRLYSHGQLESVWPVHGSVLVDDSLTDGTAAAYVAAGRSSLLDGGIRLYALEPKTGRVLRETDVIPGRRAGAIQDRILPDILSVDKGAVWMRGLGFDRNLVKVKARPHLFAPSGFLDDTWWHRTYWIYDTQMGGGYTWWPVVGNQSPAGRLLVLDDGKRIYGYGRMAYRAGDGHVYPDMAKGYTLFAENLPDAPADVKSGNRKRRIRWTAGLPFVARALVLTRDALLVAGGASPTEDAGDHGPGTLWIASRDAGSKRYACPLPAPPVLDGMALTDRGIFVSAIDGSLTRLVDRPPGKAEE